MSTPIGEKIRHVRETLKMGRQEFVDKTAIAKGTLIGIEQGRQEPKAGVLIAIAQAWPEYAAYLLTDEVGIKQKNPEVESISKELPKAKKAS
ncbi:MAG: helix-turn-helix domain-containing protein [Gallionellaceae bacterium]|jgi:transcriptional regulator with XRE-family HTH domain|nr:helix-turn-helix domain-containing protein [Gallionellaceae bacterium]